MPKTILFSNYAPFIPLATGLGENPDIQIVGIAPDWSQAVFDTGVEKVRPLASFMNPELQDEAWVSNAEILARSLASFPKNGLPDKLYDFIGERSAAFLGPRIFDLCALVYSLDACKPDLIVVHNDVEPQTRGLALWAKSRNVPCLHVPHAVYQNVRRGPTGTDVHDLITASHLASAGSFQTDWYIKRGFPKQNIFETGMPKHDELNPPPKAEARQALQIPDQAKVICYGSTWGQGTNSQGLDNEWQWVYQNFLEVCKRHPEWYPIIKCHPTGGQQNWQWHSEQAQAAGVKCIITPDHLMACLAASDAYICYGGSNSIIEATLISHLRLFTTHGFDNEEAVIKIPLDIEGMDETICKNLDIAPYSTKGLAYRFAGDMDGQATRRVAGVVIGLL